MNTIKFYDFAFDTVRELNIIHNVKYGRNKGYILDAGNDYIIFYCPNKDIVKRTSIENMEELIKVFGLKLK